MGAGEGATTPSPVYFSGHGQGRPSLPPALLWNLGQEGTKGHSFIAVLLEVKSGFWQMSEFQIQLQPHRFFRGSAPRTCRTAVLLSDCTETRERKPQHQPCQVNSGLDSLPSLATTQSPSAGLCRGIGYPPRGCSFGEQCPPPSKFSLCWLQTALALSP